VEVRLSAVMELLVELDAMTTRLPDPAGMMMHADNDIPRFYRPHAGCFPAAMMMHAKPILWYRSHDGCPERPSVAAPWRCADAMRLLLDVAEAARVWR
jgi:hypothetical protein